MIVISDTTPLRYLIEIEQVHILETLFGKIIIPKKVAEELQHPKTPHQVKSWMQALPDWLEVRKADLTFFTPQKKIDDGEREAFALALELNADAVLLDDKYALTEAKRLNLQTIALFTLFEIAAARNLINLPQTIEAIRRTNFRLPPESDIQTMLARDAQRQNR